VAALELKAGQRVAWQAFFPSPSSFLLFFSLFFFPFSPSILLPFYSLI
jgi:hypothetical protein